MLNAFVKAIGQLSDPKTRGLVWVSLFLAIAVFVGLWVGVGFLVTHTTFFQLAWLDASVSVLGALAVLVLTWFLFPAVVSAFVGIFLDSVAERVEHRHYPELPPARDMPLGEVVGTSIRFLAIMVGLNLVVLLVLIPPFTPLFPFVFYAANGYLLGREYFELVALRRVKPAEVRDFRQSRRSGVFVAGLVIAFLLTVPVVNLLAPIIGTAAMVHLLEAWRRDRPAAAAQRAHAR